MGTAQRKKKAGRGGKGGIRSLHTGGEPGVGDGGGAKKCGGEKDRVRNISISGKFGTEKKNMADGEKRP